MSIQDTYTARIDKARAGFLYGSDYNADSRIVETAAGIGFGLAVSQGTGEKGVVLGGSSFQGVTIRDITLGAEDDTYKQYKNCGVLTRGKIWVVPSVDVAVGDAVHFDAATGVFAISGGTTVTNAAWRKGAVAGQPALLEIFIPK
jgi:hypothetical protein